MPGMNIPLNMNILFRADAGEEIGSGHLMRCLGLAQYLRDEGASCSLLTTGKEEPAVARWRGEEINVQEHRTKCGSPEDAAATLAAAAAIGAQWIVADGYDFDIAWQRVAKEGGAGLLCFDDLGGAPFAADMVVNQNPGAQDLSYDMEDDGRVLSGPDYVVLRRELRHLKRETSSGAPRLLVTFGGYDLDNLALAAMGELAKLKEPFTATVICSAGTNGLEEAETFAVSHPDHFRVTPPTDMAPLMAAADLALCAAGTTALELASLGIPMVLVTVADNQEPGAAALDRTGCARLAGAGASRLAAATEIIDAFLRDWTARAAMGKKGKTMVDGRGVERIAEAMQAQQRQK
jgi:UDP-2,4-diacetamido-2,4,6-trideoxy-beta-L-altropyranose hydrolase